MRKTLNLDAAAGVSNPSSIHALGVAAAKRLAEARQGVAAALGARPAEIVFTSTATEANNLALFGLLKPGDHLVVSQIEHPSVLEPAKELEKRGVVVTFLPVDENGLVKLGELKKSLRAETKLVSIIWANNEIGVVQPMREIAKIIRRFRGETSRITRGLASRMASAPLLHTDACQATPFFDLRVSRLGVDLMTINSAKVGGPIGAAALYVKKGIPLRPQIFGGGQEAGLPAQAGRRAGTENVEAIAGFAKALMAVQKNRDKESTRLTKLRDWFIAELLKIPNVVLNGSREKRLPNNINVSFLGGDSEYVVLSLSAKGVYVSSGSACSTHTKDRSYVIEALCPACPTARRGETLAASDRAKSAVRFSLRSDTTLADLKSVLKILPPILERARRA